jgi:hypothetical protein
MKKKKENNMNKVRAVRIYTHTHISVIIGGHSRYWVLAVAYLAYGRK